MQPILTTFCRKEIWTSSPALMRGSTTSTFTGVNTYRYAQSSSSPQQLSCQGKQPMVQSPTSISVLLTWERRRATVQCKRGYIREGSGTRLLIGFWEGGLGEVGRNNPNLDNYHSKYGIGVNVWSIKKKQKTKQNPQKQETKKTKT